MKGKIIITGTEAREQIMIGVNALADAVKVTLGPAGRNVLIERNHAAPVITKDGVSVAKEVFMTNRFQNMGAQIVKQVSSRANDEAGDGTTTATVLAQELLVRGNKAIVAGATPIELKRGMELALKHAVEFIETNSTPCKSIELIRHVATISANSDTEVGDVVTSAYEKLNAENAVIAVNETSDPKTTLVISPGLSHRSGYVSELFVNSARTNRWEASNASVILLSDEEPDVDMLSKMLDSVIGKGKPILVIAPMLLNEALTLIATVKQQNMADICLARAPGFGLAQNNYMRDMAYYTGGKLIGTKGDVKEFTSPSQIGVVESATVTKNKLLISGGAGDKEALDVRIESIRSLREDVGDNEYDLANIDDRVAKLTGGIAVINVGGYSEAEVKEKRDRVDDALAAVSAAITDGVVAGGGSMLAHLSHSLGMRINELPDNDQRIGYSIAVKSFEAPLRQIVHNSGGKPDVVLDRVVNEGELLFGYDAAKETYGNLLELGIIDPAKVTRSAVVFSISVASILLTTETVIATDDESSIGYNPLNTKFGKQ